MLSLYGSEAGRSNIVVIQLYTSNQGSVPSWAQLVLVNKLEHRLPVPTYMGLPYPICPFQSPIDINI